MSSHSSSQAVSSNSTNQIQWIELDSMCQEILPLLEKEQGDNMNALVLNMRRQIQEVRSSAAAKVTNSATNIGGSLSEDATQRKIHMDKAASSFSHELDLIRQEVEATQPLNMANVQVLLSDIFQKSFDQWTEAEKSILFSSRKK
jgi:hypothetical protein